MTLEDEKKIIELYTKGKSGSEILKSLNFKFKTTKTIYDLLHRFGIRAREKWEYNSVDHFYFSKIDNQHKAYVIGLLLADGWLVEKDNSISLSLSKSDRYIINYVKKQWKTDNKIIEIPGGKKIIAGREVNVKPMSRITVASPKMVEDLYRFGFTSDKTNDAVLPPIKIDLFGHMLRGFFDGDGTLYRNSVNKKWCIRFLGTKSVVSQISYMLFHILDIDYKIPSQQRGILYYIEWYIERDLTKVLRLMYNNAEFCMRRKFNRAKLAIEESKDK